MKRTIILSIVATVLLMSLVAVMAAVHSETPNDPRVNPDANACYTGGAMAGKCGLDDQLWIAGWYFIRLQYGTISRDQFPDAYKWLLSSPPATTQEVVPTPTLKPCFSPGSLTNQEQLCFRSPN